MTARAEEYMKTKRTELAMAISDRVGYWMQTKKLSMRSVARLAGVSTQTVLNITKASEAMTLASLVAVATALGCNVTIDMSPPKTVLEK